MTSKSDHPIVFILGSWVKEKDSTRFHFEGCVTSSELPQVSAEERVLIRYQGASRPGLLEQHYGQYILEVKGQRIPLMSFLADKVESTDRINCVDAHAAPYLCLAIPERVSGQEGFRE